MKLSRGDNVHHYWDGEQRVGASVQHFVKGLEYPAWDFWMVYQPGTTWGESAPEPDWWEHQLGALGREHKQRRLDAERFAGKAEELAGTAAR